MGKIMTEPEYRAQFQRSAETRILEAAQRAPHYNSADGPKPTLQHFEVTNKSAIKNAISSFQVQGYARSNLARVSTSGSYGVPLTVYLTKEKRLRQQVEVVYFGQWANFEIGMRHLYTRAANTKSKLKLLLQNEWYASSDSPSQEWLDEQIERVRKSKLQVIIGFPSAIASIARRAAERNLRPDDFCIRGIITSGETLRDEQRADIVRTFGARCLSRYSTEELGTIAAECPEYQRHHVNEASFIVEVLDLENDSPAAPGETGRLVVTDLFSHAMPLIRYETGDLGTVSEQCPCGRQTMTLGPIEGRIVEMLTSTTGGPISPFFVNPILSRLERIDQFQFAQVGEKSYELRMVVAADSESTDVVLSRLRGTLGTDARIIVRQVASIPRLPSGKRPYVVNEWKAGRLES